jgi:hypothetical protein
LQTNGYQRIRAAISFIETLASFPGAEPSSHSRIDRTTGAGICGDSKMLLTIALILFVLWALGVFAFKVTAGVIHLVLIAALVVGLLQLFRGRRA